MQIEGYELEDEVSPPDDSIKDLLVVVSDVDDSLQLQYVLFSG